ncbi:MAG TPA: hypothetical protein VGE79_04485, partial [Niastella sp.]
LLVVGWYVIAKVLEKFDVKIYALTGFLSGHSLKHLAAAVATWYMVVMFSRKYIVFVNDKPHDYHAIT